ncbi:unnamed protein product [Rhizoctonia solani]|uniref:NACHT domain-containing protein n=1 Tax=Rhizoctonia solani TaxID=456999 RepID=A0A8H3DHI6_9AGAM|nr:unnamed protein product [Rhizoctonia solani]
MASTLNKGNRVRLRISEIGLQPLVSKKTIKGELLIDGKVADVLSAIDKGQMLKWTKLIICDANPSSRILLAVYQRNLRIYSRYESESCLVSDIMESSKKTLMINIDSVQYGAEIKALDRAQVEELSAQSREKLTKMEQTNAPSDKLKTIQCMFKSMLEFGSLVAEVHPIAKIVLAVCTRAWEKVEEQQKSDEELDDLAGRLVGMAPLVDEVRKHARLEPLRQNVEEFLHLIEDVSIFALEHQMKGFVVRVLKGVVDSSDRDRVEELGKKFQEIKEDFNTAIGVQTMAMVATADERELLKQLNPVEPSGHDPSRACLEGTRLLVLADIDDWIHDPNPSSRFMWIFGQAGIGKSTISVSVCNRLTDRETPIVSFFCKRDDPAFRDPLRLINSVAHGLACRYSPYAKLLAKAIEANAELCTSQLGVRWDGLLKKPLSGIENLSPPPVHVVLVDAMDECGTNDTRRQLLGLLQELVSLVPWLRIIVTSRPDAGIRSLLDQSDSAPVSRRDIQSYSAANDIRVFIQATVGDMAIRNKWPADVIDQLCAKAGELFIWAATACKFITEAMDSRGRLRQLIDANGSTGGFNDLDSLYLTVIENSMPDQGPDNRSIMRRCIGAIVTISMRQPVPREALCELMQAHIEPELLNNVVDRLGAVLYSDPQKKGAIRVLHPSFADFALDKSRSKDFWVDPVQRNTEVSIGCILAMERELRFNICELETSYLLNSEVPDLESKIDANISGQLAYSCIYGIDHLVNNTDEATTGCVADIFHGPRLLYWLEVLSVLQRVDIAVQGLRELSRWLMSYKKSLADYVWDAYRFVFAFFDPIIASAPHIYISALALAPRQSEVSRRLLPMFPNTAVALYVGDETWPPWLKSIAQPAIYSELRSLCVSRDGQRLVTCNFLGWGKPSKISLFDLRTGELLRTFEPSSTCHPSASLRVAISPDATLVASESDKPGEVLLWDSNTGAMIRSIQIEHATDQDIYFLAWTFASDGAALRLLVTRKTDAECSLAKQEIGSREVTKVQLLQDITEIYAAAFSPDGAQVAIAYRSEQVHLMVTQWSDQVDTPRLSLRIEHEPRVIVFSPDGTLIATISNIPHPGIVHILDTKTGVARILTKYNERVDSIAFAPNSTQVVISANGVMQIWDTQTCTAISSPVDLFVGSGLRDEVSIAYSPDGACILTGFRGDATVRMWDASLSSASDYRDETRTSRGKYSGHPDKVTSVVFSHDGSCIISGSADCTSRCIIP